MFVARVAPFPYSDPWGTPLGERRAALLQGSPRVAYYYDRPDNSTFRYRVYNMIQALRAPGRSMGAAFFEHREIEQLGDLLDEIDALVVCRASYSDAVNRLICRARAKRKRVLFDVDDLVFANRFTPLLVNTLDQDVSDPKVWDVFFAYTGRIEATLALCDAAITTNDFLAERLRELAGKPAAVVPNFLNREQMELSERIYRRKVDTGFARDRHLTLGYFSGTPTHNKDLQVAADALADLLARNDSLRLRIVGFMELKGALRGLERKIESFPLQDFMNLQRLMGEVELNLVPLQNNTFTNCKSELKYFEAGIAGTLSVASPVHTYARVIRDGDNGFLANAHAWGAKIAEALERLDEYPALAARTRNECEARYGWMHQFAAINKAIFY